MMNIALQIMAIITLSIMSIICIWGFVLFYKFTNDTKKQNMMLFSILERLGSNKDQ